MRLRTRVQASTLFHQPHGGAGGRGGHGGRSGGLSAHCEHRVRGEGRTGRGAGEKRQRKQRRLESGRARGPGPLTEDDRRRRTRGPASRRLGGQGLPVRAGRTGRPQHGHSQVTEGAGCRQTARTDHRRRTHKPQDRVTLSLVGLPGPWPRVPDPQPAPPAPQRPHAPATTSTIQLATARRSCEARPLAPTQDGAQIQHNDRPQRRRPTDARTDTELGCRVGTQTQTRGRWGAGRRAREASGSRGGEWAGSQPAGEAVSPEKFRVASMVVRMAP